MRIITKFLHTVEEISTDSHSDHDPDGDLQNLHYNPSQRPRRNTKLSAK